MPSLRRFAVAVAALAAAAGAVDVPAGAMPDIDGRIGAGEWDGAAVLRSGPATARLRTAGRALCLALAVDAPYRGERIDLRVCDARGQDLAWISFHPACHLPAGRAAPIPPVLARHSSFVNRDEAGLEPPFGCRFRARVFRSANSWTAEAAVAFESLDMSPDQALHFQLDLAMPADDKPFLRLAPPRGEAPDAWQTLRVAFPGTTGLFATSREDEIRAFERDVFAETLRKLVGRDVEKPMLTAALERTKDNGKIDALETKLRGALELDAGDWFAHATLVHLLRRANRHEKAAEALDAWLARFPYADTQATVVQERLALLLASQRFDDLLKLRLGERQRALFVRLRDDWQAEQRRRAAETGLPRVKLATTRGDVVVELFRADTPDLVAAFTKAVAARKLDGVAFAGVSGAIGARAPLPGAPATLGAPPRAPARLAWRGTLGLAVRPGDDPAVLPELILATGPVHLMRPVCAIGRVVAGQDVVDALDVSDKIVSAGMEPER